MPKKLLFVTGTRADFGKLEPLAVAACDAGFSVAFFVTGMHMLSRYGSTYIEVHRLAGIEHTDFINQREGDPQDLVLSKTVLGFSDFLHENRPDLVIVHGDRVEALACALVCATNYIRCAHIEGGEVSGTIDEIFRHCNSKLASCHFVSSDTAAARVRALGEAVDTIHNIGSPELDTHGRPSGVDISEVKKRYEIPFDDYGIAVFHPVTSEQDTMGAQARSLYGSLEKSGRNFVVIAPNNDPGSGDLFTVLSDLPKSRFRLLSSMRFAYFSELMKNASALVGNSSAGVREAPFLGLPSLDIGTRQNRRSDANSITNCSAFESEVIGGFLRDTWGKDFPSHASFGTGNSAARFVEVLQDDDFWTKSMQKDFSDA